MRFYVPPKAVSISEDQPLNNRDTKKLLHYVGLIIMHGVNLLCYWELQF